MLGFFLIILFEGLAIKHFPNNRLIHAAGIILGTACCYFIGTLWLSHLLGLTFAKGLAAGVIPFIPGDIGKAAAALLIAPVLRTRLQTAGLTLR